MLQSLANRSRRIDWLLITGLMIVAGAIHGWQIQHTAVTARDGVGFIRYAWQLESLSWRDVLRENPHPPGYPLAILAISLPVRHLFAGAESEMMQLSAQLANALAGVLLVIPMYFLGKLLFDRRVGVGSAMLFQCLPVASRAMADALTEGTYLLFLATALLFAITALGSGNRWHYSLSGVFAGLAYLTRPEGMLVWVATLLVLFGLQWSPVWRRPWRNVLACSACLTLAAVTVATPYIMVIGHITNKTTGRNILQAVARNEMAPTELPNAGGVRTALAAMPLAVFGPHSKDLSLSQRNLWCLGAIAEEVIKGYHYLAWLPAAIGIWWFRRLLWDRPGTQIPLVLIALNTLVLWRVAYVEGYVAERHSLTIVLCSIFWAVATIVAFGERISGWLAGLFENRRIFANSPAWSAGLLLVLAASGLPRALAPLHTNRTGFHAAGVWLAQNAGPDDQIVDPFSWVEFYSGQVRRQLHQQSPQRPPDHVYVILGGTKNEHERLPLIPEAKSLAQRGHIVYQWPEKPIRFSAEDVVVYRVPPNGGP